MRPLLALAAAAVALGCTDSGRVLGARPDDRTASAVATGMVHACAIVQSRGLCWGDNTQGQLGTGDTEARSRPAPLALESTLVGLCAGTAHGCALDTDGGIWCWGGNERGQLGSGTRDATLAPQPVPLVAPARSIACSFNHSCAVLDDDRLYCWGQNDEGELGQGDAFPGDGSTAADGLSPVQVPGAWRTVDTGQGHSCAIAGDGSLWCWGRNSFFELGTEPQGQIRSPVRVGEASDWESIDAGQNHSCGLRRDGTLWCWGRNTASDQEEGFPLGLEGPLVVPQPTQVGSSGGWTRLSTSIFHSCAIDRAGVLSCWGRNIEGQLGLGGVPLVRAPTIVMSGVASVAVGGFFSCAVGLDGGLSCAGENSDGQLGTGDRERRSEFTAIELR